MTKEIRRIIKHVLEVSERMVVRELPKISAAIRAFNNWINGIDYRKARQMEADPRKTYDRDKVTELEEEISKINKEA